MTLSLSISIPAYNEAGSLPEVIAQSFQVLQQLTEDYEVVVIDDGSQDGTVELLQQLSKAQPRLIVKRHAKNEGLGVTLKEVFEIPSKDAIFFIPGDGQIPPDALNVLFPALQSFDLVLGWRKSRQDAFQRHVMAFLYNLLISVVLRKRVNDVDSVMLIKRKVYQALNLKSQSAFRHAEFILQAQRLGFRWTEIPIHHVPRKSGTSKVINGRNLWPIFQDLFRYVFRPREA